MVVDYTSSLFLSPLPVPGLLLGFAILPCTELGRECVPVADFANSPPLPLPPALRVCVDQVPVCLVDVHDLLPVCEGEPVCEPASPLASCAAPVPRRTSSLCRIALELAVVGEILRRGIMSITPKTTHAPLTVFF